jgi:hypothetical protein
MSIRSMPSNEKFRKNYDRVFRGGITRIKPSWTPVFTDDDGNEITPRRIENRQPFDTIVGSNRSAR